MVTAMSAMAMAVARRQWSKLAQDLLRRSWTRAGHTHGGHGADPLPRISKFDFGGKTHATRPPTTSFPGLHPPPFRAISFSSVNWKEQEGKGEGKAAGAATPEEIEFDTPASVLFRKEILEGKPQGSDFVYSDEFFEGDQVDDEEIESLLTQQDLSGIPGLPPLAQILEEDPEAEAKARRRELEMLKQEEIKRLRVQRIDEMGRAYATGKRKTSSARVWIWPGSGKMTVNRLPFDVYFPDLNIRTVLLQPFVETDTLGKFDVRCTVAGGGVSGQAGATRHGISKALQLFDPELRPPLKKAGLLTRDPRVVERKKPGKAKARKSFQWVKR